jgi:hypothetical protein
MEMPMPNPKIKIWWIDHYQMHMLQDHGEALRMAMFANTPEERDAWNAIVHQLEKLSNIQPDAPAPVSEQGGGLGMMMMMMMMNAGLEVRHIINWVKNSLA